MSQWKRVVGLDLVDFAIHVAVTCMVLAFVAMSGGPEEMLPVITGLSLIALGVRRHAALRRTGSTPGLTTDEVAAERIAELEQRVDELEAAQGRLVELEDRVDFAERLLAKSGQDLLPSPRGEPR